MDFNMLANQSTGIVPDHKGLMKALVKIRMDKDKKVIENLSEWVEALKNAFVTFSLARFLKAEYGMQVPSGQVAEILKEEAIALTLGNMQKKLLSQEKNEKLLRDVASRHSSSVKKEPAGEEKKQVKPTAADMLTHLWPDIEKMVRENADSLAAADKKKQIAAEESGELQEALYVNPLTRVKPEFSRLNPNATITLGESDPFLYEVESKKFRTFRMAAYGAIKSTLADIPKRVWKHVAVGNVYGLYSLVINNYAAKGRASVVDDLFKRLSTFKKLKRESFVQFRARFEQLIAEIKDAKVEVDSTQIANSAQNAIVNSDDAVIKRVFKNWVLNNKSKMTDPFVTFEEMAPVMLIEEQDKMNTSRRKKERERESEGEVEQTLRTISGKNQGAGGSYSPSSGDRDLLSFCLSFQTKKGCRKEKCSFTHRKLSPKDVVKLEKQIKARRAEKEENMPSTKCYQCGETGHFQYACPKGQDGNTATTNLARARSRERSREQEEGPPFSAEELARAAKIIEFHQQTMKQGDSD